MAAIKMKAANLFKGQKYREEYTRTWSFIKKSSLGEHYVKCELCRTDFSIKHSGKYDISTHMSSTKHAKHVQPGQGMVKLDCFISAVTSLKSSVIESECLMTNFIIEHNLPVSIADHMTDLVRRMFPDSSIAKEYGCRRTKTTHIMHSMAEETIHTIQSVIHDNAFSIATDGSEHKSRQLYPILIRYPSRDVKKIVTGLLSIAECKEHCTGENIFALVDECVKKNSDWKKVVALSVDNASTMIGRNMGVAGHILRVESSIFITGCTCHLIHLAAGKAADKLPLGIDDLLLDIYHYLDKSHKRQKLLSDFQELCGTDTLAILKHCATRWLSLESCIQRLLKQWEPLVCFFQKETETSGKHHKKDAAGSLRQPPPCVTLQSKAVTTNHKAASSSEPPSKKLKTAAKSKVPKNTTETASKVPKNTTETASKVPKNTTETGSKVPKNTTETGSTMCSSYKHEKVCRIYELMIDPATKLYCFFLEATIPVFNTMNLLLQRDEPCIHILHDTCVQLLTDLYVRFVRADAIMKAAVFKVNYKEKKTQKHRETLVIGCKTRDFLNDCKEEQKMNSDQRQVFFDSVRDYYCRAVEYILSKFPLDCELLKHAEILDPQKKTKTNFESVVYFVDRFPCLHYMKPQLDVLQMEYLRYQVSPAPDIDIDRIDTMWMTLESSYPLLAKVMFVILVIPHSNADAERVFSLVRKTDTEFRPNLGLRLLESTLVTIVDNIAKDTPCYKKKFSNEFLKIAKKSTYMGLKKDNEPEDDPAIDINTKVLKMLENPVDRKC